MVSKNDLLPATTSVISGLELSRIPTADLKSELARGLTLTAEVLTRLGLIWQELERRGEDLSDLRQGLARTLPLIAAGLLAAEAVVSFAGRPAILRTLEGVPLDQQRAFASGEPLAVIDPTNPERVESLPLAQLPAAAIRLAIVGGEIRSPEVQRLSFRTRRPRRQEPERIYRPRYDRQTGMVTIGRMQLRLADLLAELSAAAGPDNSLIDAEPDKYVQTKVRLTPPESKRLLNAARLAELPDWELIRKALRAFGLI